MTTIARIACDSVRRNVSANFANQKNEYTSFFNNHESRLAALENLTKISNNSSAPHQIHLLANKNHLQNQNQYHTLQKPQNQSQIASLIQDSNNVLYRGQTPAVSTQSLIYNSAFENNFHANQQNFANANQQNLKFFNQ